MTEKKVALEKQEKKLGRCAVGRVTITGFICIMAS
jgi:hypothetical protein